MDQAMLRRTQTVDAEKLTRSSERQSDQAFAKIYAAITECELAPGLMVSEPQLEQMFDFSRVALRVAVDRLAQLQLIRPVHRKGYQIAPLTLRDIKNAFDLRLLVEPSTARTAVGRIDIERLKKVNEKSVAPVGVNDRIGRMELISANHEFHLMIAATAQNDRLYAVVAQVLRDIDRVYHFGLVRDPRYARMQEEHFELINALERGDGDAAERVAREHIEDGRRIAMDAIINSSNLADISIGPIGK
jgi:DNA-binding GntR family transcriptional regulator